MYLRQPVTGASSERPDRTRTRRGGRRADCENGAKTVSRWRRLSPLPHIPVTHRFARTRSLKNVVLSLKRDHLNRQNAPSLLLLLVGLAMTFFVAGIAVPSLIRSGVDMNEGMVRGSLHSINVSGITFSYTYDNLASAISGILASAAVAFLIAYRVTTPDSITSGENRANKTASASFATRAKN